MSATTAIEDAGPSPLRRNRDFQLLLSGFSISMLGSRVSAIAYPLLVLALTGSPVVAGWVCFATIAPSILVYLPAGALVDRWDPRRAMRISELGRGTAIATIVIALMLHRLSVVELAAAGAIEQILEVFSVLAERCLVRSVVEPAQATSALARGEARAHLVILVGRPLGALLFDFGRIVPFVADILSFAVSVGVLTRLRNRKGASPPEQVTSRHLAREIGDGFLWLRRNPFAGIALPLTAGTTLIVQALIMVVLAEAHTRHLRPITIGMVLAASGAGGALGSMVGPWLFPRIGYSLLKIQMFAWSATLALLALSGGRSFPSIAAAMAVLGLTGALGNIAVDTFVIRNAAETMLARLMSVDRLTSFGAIALGPLLGGFLVENYGPQSSIWTLLVMTTLLLVAAVAAPSSPGDRDVQVAGRTSSLKPASGNSSGTRSREGRNSARPEAATSKTKWWARTSVAEQDDLVTDSDQAQAAGRQQPELAHNGRQHGTIVRRPGTLARFTTLYDGLGRPWPAGWFSLFFRHPYSTLASICRVTTGVPPAEHKLQTELIDVTGVDLADCELLDDSVLANCVRRFRAEAESPGDTLAGFNNSL